MNSLLTAASKQIFLPNKTSAFLPLSDVYGPTPILGGWAFWKGRLVPGGILSWNGTFQIWTFNHREEVFRNCRYFTGFTKKNPPAAKTTPCQYKSIWSKWNAGREMSAGTLNEDVCSVPSFLWDLCPGWKSSPKWHNHVYAKFMQHYSWERVVFQL